MEILNVSFQINIRNKGWRMYMHMHNYEGCVRCEEM